MALLPVHSQKYSQIRKKSFKHACKKVAVSQRTVSYRGQPLTPTMLRRMGNCPPPARTKVASAPRARAGRATQALRVLLQETHWQATAEFTASGWYCVSSASPDDTLKAKKTKKGRGGTARPVKEAEARPESSQDQTPSGPSVARADGVMVLMSPRIAAKSVRWQEHVVVRALEVRFDWQGARVTVVAVYQHVWSPAKTVHNNRQDRASLLKALGRCIKLLKDGKP